MRAIYFYILFFLSGNFFAQDQILLDPPPGLLEQLRSNNAHLEVDYLRSDDPILPEFFCPTECNNVNFGILIGASITNCSNEAQTVFASISSKSSFFFFQSIGDFAISDMGSFYGGEMIIKTGQTVLFAAQFGAQPGQHELNISVEQGENVFTQTCNTEIRNNFITDVEITKVVNDTTPTVGDTICYTLTIKNIGSEPAETPDVFEFIPEGLKLISMDCDGETVVASTGQGCRIAESLSPGDSVEIKVTTEVLLPGEIVNSASVSTCSFDSIQENNFAEETIVVEEGSPIADLKITKTASSSIGKVGDDPRYTLQIVNCGQATAQGIKLLDSVPQSMIIHESVASTKFKNKPGSAGACTVNGNAINCNLSNMEKGDTIEVDYFVEYVQPDSNALNIAIVSSETPDADETNNSVIHEAVIQGFADIGIKKEFFVDEIDIKDSILVTLKYFNNGPDPVTGIEIMDPIDTCFEYLSGDIILCKFEDGVFKCIGKDLEPGEAWQADYYVRAKTRGVKYNTATIMHKGVDVNPENDISTDSIRIINNSADVSIRKSILPSEVVETEKPFIYRLEISNNGPQTATNIKIRDTFSTNNVVVQSVPEGCSVTSRVITCDIESLESGDEKFFDISAMTVVKQNFTNFAEITSSSPLDPNPSNNQDEVRTHVLGSEETMENFPESGAAIDPISTLNGEFGHRELQLFGAFYPLVIINLVYHSLLSSDGRLAGPIGPGWKHSLEISLEYNTPYVEIVFPNGQVHSFIHDLQTDKFTAITAFDSYLSRSENTYILNAGIMIYVFNKSGQLVEINNALKEDRVTVEYDESKLDIVSLNGEPIYEFTYNATGGLSSIMSPVKAITFSSDDEGRLSSLTDIWGNVINYTYDGMTSRLLTRSSNGNPSDFINTYNEQGKVVHQKIGNHSSTITYSEDGITTVEDQQGSSFSHTHLDNRLTQIKSKDDNPITIAYDGNKRLANVGKTKTEVEFNGDKLPTKLSFNGKEVVALEYETIDRNQQKIILPEQITVGGETWSVVRDENGRRNSISNSLGETWQYDYPSSGSSNPTRITDPSGKMYHFEFNGLGKIAKIEIPGERNTSYEYDQAGRLILIRHPDNSTTSYSYDDENNSLVILDQFGIEKKIQYDENQNLEKYQIITGEVTNTLEAEYDGLDRMTRLILNGSGPTASYNDDGSLSGITTSEGETYEVTTNSKNQITSLMSPDQSSSNYEFGPDGVLERILQDGDERLKVEKLPNAAGFMFRQGDDQISFMTGVSSLDIQSDRYNIQLTKHPDQNMVGGNWGGIPYSIERNHADLPTKVTYGEGATSTFSYDGGKLTKSIDPSGVETSFEYNSHGNIISKTEADQTTTYTFNERNLLTAVSTPDDETFNYQYDASGRVASSDNHQFKYDQMGNLIQSDQYKMTYMQIDQLSSIDYGESKKVVYEYNPVGQVKRVTDFTGHQTTFEYNTRGKLKKVVRPNGTEVNYTYRSDRRLASITEKTKLGPQRTVLTWGPPDVVKSIVRSGPIPIPYPTLPMENKERTYNVQNKLPQYAYDAKGNITDNGRAAFNYNSKNLPKKIAFQDFSIDLKFDEFGAIREIDDQNGKRIINHNYAFLSPKVMQEQNADGFLEYFIYTPNGSLLYSIDSNNEFRFYHYDENGRVHFLTDLNGDVVQSFNWSPHLTQFSPSINISNQVTKIDVRGTRHLGDGLILDSGGKLYDAEEQTHLNINKPTDLDPRNMNPYPVTDQNPKQDIKTIDHEEEFSFYELIKTTNSWWQIGENINGTCGLNSWSELFFNKERLGFLEQHILQEAVEARRLEKRAKTSAGKKVQAAKFNRTMQKVSKLEDAFDKAGKASSAVSAVTLIADAYSNIQKVKKRFECYEEANYLEYVSHLLEALRLYKTGAYTYFEYLELVDRITVKYAYYYEYSSELILQEIKYAAIESIMDVVSDVIPLPEQLSIKKNVLKALFGQESFLIE